MYQSFRDLVVWQKAMNLAKEIYALTRQFPKDELFGLSSQMRRAAVSIPSNIAEGHARNSPKEFLNFLSIAKGSAAELSTQLELCAALDVVSAPAISPLLSLSEEVGRMLTALSSRIRSAPPKTRNLQFHPRK